MKWSRFTAQEGSRAELPVIYAAGVQVGVVDLSLNHFRNPYEPNEYQIHLTAKLMDRPHPTVAGALTQGKVVAHEGGWIFGLAEARAHLEQRAAELVPQVLEAAASV